MFQFTPLAPLSRRKEVTACFQTAGFPHSGTPGSLPACGSPRIFAAYHALLRRSVPRHPPCALLRLTGNLFLFRPFTLALHSLPFSFLLLRKDLGHTRLPTNCALRPADQPLLPVEYDALRCGAPSSLFPLHPVLAFSGNPIEVRRASVVNLDTVARPSTAARQREKPGLDVRAGFSDGRLLFSMVFGALRGRYGCPARAYSPLERR